MQIERRDVESALPKKGFQREDTHHIYFHHYYQGKYTGISTYVSHGTSSIGDSLIQLMKRQLHLSSSHQVAGLVKCPISGDEYIQLLKTTGQL
jgi:hypothetical protein